MVTAASVLIRFLAFWHSTKLFPLMFAMRSFTVSKVDTFLLGRVCLLATITFDMC